jgi:hypothetical protein
MHFLIGFLVMAGATCAALLFVAASLHIIPRLGVTGRHISESFCRAPALDWLVMYFTVAPLIVGPIIASWAGFLGAIVGQVASVLLWTAAQEILHRNLTRGPRIVSVINRIIGPWRNHAAIWLTAIVTPLFSVVRLAEIFLYPQIAWLVGFPRYNQGEWVNVSRHKFRGLIGHDLIWCLYCDWMTGIWSLGTEMLRNVESFWCPIRFDNSKKCENCVIDFPDLNNGWIPANGEIAQVAAVLEQAHSGPTRAWFGHPVRVTVAGKEVTAV